MVYFATLAAVGAIGGLGLLVAALIFLPILAIFNIPRYAASWRPGPS